MNFGVKSYFIFFITVNRRLWSATIYENIWKSFSSIDQSWHHRLIYFEHSFHRQKEHSEDFHTKGCVVSFA